MKKKLKKKDILAFAKEEIAASKEYTSLGLKAFGKDEARHARFFKMLAGRK